MTALVILHHTAITYGAPGGWFWNELHPSASPVSFLLTLFVSTNQAYFMGFFFLLAGYFTPASLERKGYARFMGDRFLRLGLPLLAFGLLLGPLTAAIVTAYEGRGFWPTINVLWQRKEFINGPLWFAQALLIFSLAYCLWRAWFGTPLSQSRRTSESVPAFRWWLISALAVGAAALAIRQIVPVGVNVIGLQLGYFAAYIFLFGAGIAAWRHDWLRQLNWKHARPWVIGLALTWPIMPVAIIAAIKLNGPGKSNFSGGLTWPAIVYAFWEPFVAWGLIAAWLLFARARMNQAVDPVVLAQPPRLRGLHHSSPVLVGICATAARLGRAGIDQVRGRRDHWHHRNVAGFRSARSACPACAAWCSPYRLAPPLTEIKHLHLRPQLAILYRRLEHLDLQLRIPLRHAGAQIEGVVMPRARDAALFDDSFAKRSAFVRTNAVEHADLSIHIGHAKSPPCSDELVSLTRRPAARIANRCAHIQTSGVSPSGEPVSFARCDRAISIKESSLREGRTTE